MLEAVQGQTQPFNAIKYTTKHGENCVATKKDGIVTIQGDKNGTRKMPLNEFMDAFIKDQQLEKTPKKDEVSFSGNDQTTKRRSHAWMNTLLAATLGSLIGEHFFYKSLNKACERFYKVIDKHPQYPGLSEIGVKLQAKNNKAGKAFLATSLALFGLTSLEAYKIYKNRKQIKAEEKAKTIA